VRSAKTTSVVDKFPRARLYRIRVEVNPKTKQARRWRRASASNKDNDVAAAFTIWIPDQHFGCIELKNKQSAAV